MSLIKSWLLNFQELCSILILLKLNFYKLVISSITVVRHFSPVQLLGTPWTVARQAPLSMGFSRQEDWSGLPRPRPGHLPDPGMEPACLLCPALAGGLFTTSTTWQVQYLIFKVKGKCLPACVGTGFPSGCKSFARISVAQTDWPFWVVKRPGPAGVLRPWPGLGIPSPFPRSGSGKDPELRRRFCLCVCNPTINARLAFLGMQRAVTDSSPHAGFPSWDPGRWHSVLPALAL